MKKLFIVFAWGVLWSTGTLADEPVHGPETIDVHVSVGSADGKHVYVPDQLTFERGKYYRLVLQNVSPVPHYFTSDTFATHIFTRKVEVMGADGKVMAEVHGPVNDLELGAGTTVAWYFYPMTRAENIPVYCHKEGHEGKGMKGAISIVGPPPFTK